MLVGQNYLLVDTGHSANDAFTDSYLKAVAVSGLLYDAERVFKESIKKLYGGAYQIAGFNGVDAAKIGDVTYVFYRANVNEGKVAIESPNGAIKVEYFDDVMGIRVDTFEYTGGNRIGQKVIDYKPRFLKVDPIERFVDQSELARIKMPKIQSRTVCHIVSFANSNGKYTNAVGVRVGSPGPGIEFRLNATDSVETIRCDERLLEQLIAIVIDLY